MCYSAIVKRQISYLEQNYGAIAVRDQLEDYEHRSLEDPKAFPPLRSRIYPGHFAAVIIERDGQRGIEVMRYGAFPPPSIQNAKKYTTFNARRDNLTSSFWSNAFMSQHGFIVLEGFYEWVSVKDLIKAGVVSLKDVEEEFRRQSDARKSKLLAQGKPWKLTPTEKKSPLERAIIIEFKPEDGSDLIAPVIISSAEGNLSQNFSGFAIVTDDPPFEIEQAGHDRCPVILEPGAEESWLDFQGLTAKELDEILSKRRRVTFKHKLAVAA